MQAGSRKNMDRMAEVVPDTKSRNLQQFLTHSKWNARDVMDHVAHDANALLGDNRKAGLLIDESGFAKQGKMSVGTARQWLGRLGKVDNGQVAVYGVLAKDRFTIPVDGRLYLPKKWTEDSNRCEKAGIPEHERIFYTKDELALGIVSHSRKNGLCFAWVGADGGYGKGPRFCIALDRMGECFMVDLHSDVRVYLEDPRPYIPENDNRRGRKHPLSYRRGKHRGEKCRGFPRPFQAACIVAERHEQGTTQGSCSAPSCVCMGRETNEVHRYSLLATQTLGKNPEIKISLSNAPETTDLETFGLDATSTLLGGTCL